MFVNNASRSVAALLLGAWLFVPQVALADDECGMTDGDPNTADTVICDPADYDSGYPDGITYTSSDGDLSLEVPDGPDQLNVFDGGLSVSGNNADSIFLEAGGYTNQMVGTDGAVIEYSSDTGHIGINAPEGSNSTGSRAFSLRAQGSATHGILATSTGGGNIDIETRAILGNDSFTAIEAKTGGGNIDINLMGRIDAGDYGVVAETAGDGNINILSTSPIVDSSITGLKAVAGSGDINLTLQSIINFASDVGLGIHVDTDGIATIDMVDAGIVRGIETAIRGEGNRVVVNLDADPAVDVRERGGIRGPLDFSTLTGHAEVHIGTGNAWFLGIDVPDGITADPIVSTDSVFSAGDDLVTVAPDGYLATRLIDTAFSGPSPTVAQDRHTVDFGMGEDVVDNAGTLFVGPGRSSLALNKGRGYEAEMRLENLERFNNSGSIWFGANISSGVFLETTDLWPDDILAMPGATFVGGEGSRIVLDTDLNITGQSACNAGLRNADGDLAIDCIDLSGSGGAATGRTEVLINEVIPGDRGAYNPDGNVIVDIGGSDPAQTDPDAFVLSPESSRYLADIGNGAIEKGMFFYTIAYEPDTQQFKLFGLPAAGTQQLALLPQAANDLWRTGADAWFGRRVDERDLDLQSRGGGTWARATANSGERDLITPIVAGGETLGFDNSYTQDSSTLTLGRDLIFRNGGDSAWLVGAMIGYSRARVDYDASTNTANLEGMHAGFYGSFTTGAFFLDAVLGGSQVDVDNDVPRMQLRPEGTLLSTRIDSLGGQIEAGWRLGMGRFGVEPLAGLSYVVSGTDDLSIPADDPERFGGEAKFDDATSLRGSLGARLSMADVLPGLVPTEISLTARAIEEFDGDSEVSIANAGPIDAPVSDTFDGTFAQVTGSVSIHNAAKTVAGYLNVDGTFESDYERVGVEAGFRYRW